MLVIDASALVEVLTADPDEIHELAQRVLDAERMSPPNLIDYQVLNVLRRMVFGGDIDGELAEDTRRTLRALRLTRYPPTDEMSDRVWQLRHNASAYDASYLALAEQPDVPVVTADGRLGRGLQSSTSVKIETYAVEIDPS